MGGSINGGFLSLVLEDELVSSESEIRNTFDVELMERCRYVSWEGDVVALLVI